MGLDEVAEQALIEVSRCQREKWRELYEQGNWMERPWGRSAADPLDHGHGPQPVDGAVRADAQPRHVPVHAEVRRVGRRLEWMRRAVGK